MTRIKEIFTSIQGEGPYVGYKQAFVRFCKCNLNCKYCDTDFIADKDTKDFSPKELADYVNAIQGIHSLSLTGGEPLLETDFLKDFLPLCKHKIYLETNATLPDKLSEIVEYVDIISADIKLESATANKNSFNLHDKFFGIAKSKELFAKMVFNKDITEYEIAQALELVKRYDIELILQPQMKDNHFAVDACDIERIFNLFSSEYNKVRLIPQVHKFLNVQ